MIERKTMQLEILDTRMWCGTVRILKKFLEYRYYNKVVENKGMWCVLKTFCFGFLLPLKILYRESHVTFLGTQAIENFTFSLNHQLRFYSDIRMILSNCNLKLQTWFNSHLLPGPSWAHCRLAACNMVSWWSNYPFHPILTSQLLVLTTLRSENGERWWKEDFFFELACS